MRPHDFFASARVAIFALTALAMAPVGLGGCGPGGARPEVEFKPPPDAREGEGRFEGRLDAEDVRRVVQAQQAGFDNCFRRSSGQYLAGDVYVQFVIGKQGRVNLASVQRSELGSWVVEDCLIETATFLEFPPPVGGEATFAYPFAGPTVGRRLVQAVDPAWGYETIRGARKAINRCRAEYGYQGPFHITVYVGPLGVVLDAGFDALDRPRREFPACVHSTVRGLRFPNPGNRTVKYRTIVETLDDGA
jgi:hypothetical protein